jgi:EAL and modified HD-GYP domain-containing signal transduction protein
MFGWLTEKKFDWCDSHFLTVRNPLAGPEPDLTRLKLLKLLNLVRQDGDTREIEGIFREEPKLSYNLLRLVNSVAVGARTRISNFSQAIAILGRRQLQRWLQLLIYADNLANGNAPNPLMQLAAARGRLMELLSVAIEPEPDIPDLSDNAFMTGLFSLLDVLINLPMKEILKELPLQPEVVDALNSPADDGIFGQLLSAIIAGESGNFSDAEAIFSGLGISPATHAKSQVTALYWAARINIDNHD